MAGDNTIVITQDEVPQATRDSNLEIVLFCTSYDKNSGTEDPHRNEICDTTVVPTMEWINGCPSFSVPNHVVALDDMTIINKDLKTLHFPPSGGKGGFVTRIFKQMSTHAPGGGAEIGRTLTSTIHFINGTYLQEIGVHLDHKDAIEHRTFNKFLA